MKFLRAPILFLTTLSLFGCGYHPMTIEEFHTSFARNCPNGYFIKKMDKKAAQATCSCMEAEAARRWSSMEQLWDSLEKEDRSPRGEGDFVDGAARITFRSCQQQANQP